MRLLPFIFTLIIYLTLHTDGFFIKEEIKAQQNAEIHGARVNFPTEKLPSALATRTRNVRSTLQQYESTTSASTGKYSEFEITTTNSDLNPTEEVPLIKERIFEFISEVPTTELNSNQDPNKEEQRRGPLKSFSSSTAVFNNPISMADERTTSTVQPVTENFSNEIYSQGNLIELTTGKTEIKNIAVTRNIDQSSADNSKLESTTSLETRTGWVNIDGHGANDGNPNQINRIKFVTEKTPSGNEPTEGNVDQNWVNNSTLESVTDTSMFTGLVINDVLTSTIDNTENITNSQIKDINADTKLLTTTESVSDDVNTIINQTESVQENWMDSSRRTMDKIISKNEILESTTKSATLTGSLASYDSTTNYDNPWHTTNSQSSNIEAESEISVTTFPDYIKEQNMGQLYTQRIDTTPLPTGTIGEINNRPVVQGFIPTNTAKPETNPTRIENRMNFYEDLEEPTYIDIAYDYKSESETKQPLEGNDASNIIKRMFSEEKEMDDDPFDAEAFMNDLTEYNFQDGEWNSMLPIVQTEIPDNSDNKVNVNDFAGIAFRLFDDVTTTEESELSFIRKVTSNVNAILQTPGNDTLKEQLKVSALNAITSAKILLNELLQTEAINKLAEVYQALNSSFKKFFNYYMIGSE